MPHVPQFSANEIISGENSTPTFSQNLPSLRNQPKLNGFVQMIQSSSRSMERKKMHLEFMGICRFFPVGLDSVKILYLSFSSVCQCGA